MPDHQKPPLLIIGIGNPFRSDDAAGLQAVRLLGDTGIDASNLLEHSGEGASLMEAWNGRTIVILIDAVSSGRPPGTIHRLEPLNDPLPAQLFQSSTHAFSLPQAIEMSRALGELPSRLMIFGIEGCNFQPGTELSPEVSASLPKLAREVLNEVEKLKLDLQAGGELHA
jgi:hydrogenase maturation protease